MEDINGKNAREDVEERYLPDELITQHILPWLPIKPLTQCKLVSKEWNSTISQPNYILNHFNKSIFSDPFTPVESLFIQSGGSFYLYPCPNLYHDDENVDNDEVAQDNLVYLNVDFEYENTVTEVDEIKLVGSSNGLVCLGGRIGKYFCLYNPNTNQSHKCYPADFDYWKSIRPIPPTSWGFGYVSSIDDYKVVRIIAYRNGEVAIVHVYSLRSNIWSKIESCIEVGDMIIGRAKLVNETLYWSMCSGRTIAFDLARETFEYYPHLGIIPPFSNALCVMGGCLSKYSSNYQNDMFLEIIKQSGRMIAVRFSCNLGNFEQLIGFTKTGEVFFTRSKPGTLGLLDRCSKETLATFGDQMFLVESYVPTQSSPHPAAEVPNEPAEGFGRYINRRIFLIRTTLL
ncbi:F-box/kelch-repeat protein At3g23880-like isoform X2 [Chenopodium quinoa]|uniref:F-box/kelch-repeat protein At3g23880-like isoform X2 n=1 Tax=Chenopodium quinoa TaxID=63459 RepID=UPI000B798274|nr:F-box/kelch-repeat protein At3g23880-like isoform X2 [Chenopodium quinoa]